jgi:cobaltochelatase CobS
LKTRKIMASSWTTINGYQRDIGCEPFTLAAAHLIVDDHTRALLRAWLAAKGAPATRTMYASDSVLKLAYTKAQHLQKMLPKSASRDGWVDNSFTLDDIDPKTMGEELAEAAIQPPIEPTPRVEGVQVADTATAIARAADVILRKALNEAIEKLTVANATNQAQMLASLTETLERSTTQIARDCVREVARDIIEEMMPARQVVITNPTTNTTITMGLQHERFPTLLRAVGCRDHRGTRLNIWLTGPTGSGKTTAAENVARALEPTFKQYRNTNGQWEILNLEPTDGVYKLADLNGLAHDSPFGADSSLDADYKVVGFKDGAGVFHWTTFLRIFKFGGVYVADEIDNWDPSALVALNSALANGWISTPIGLIRRHPDCCIIAGANTWGYGATNDYVGRNKLDAATINRFPTKIDWPIDTKLEFAVAHNMAGAVGTAWCKVVQSARKHARDAGLEIIYSPRNTFDGIALLTNGFTVHEVVEMNLLAGLDKDQCNAMDRAISTPISTVVSTVVQP